MPQKQEQSTKRRPATIPRGFRSVTPYLSVTGGAKALDFYKKAFDAVELQREALPDGKLIHARIRIGNSIVMLSDSFSDSPPPAASPVTLQIYTSDVSRLWKQAIAAGAKVGMPLEDQFWGERYGQLVDPFGHNWSLSMRIPMSRKEMEEKRRASMAMFEQGENPGAQEQGR
jgi:PhnB protein